MSSIFWLIVVVGLLALLQVKYYQKQALKNLSYTRTVSRQNVFEGEKTILVETLNNHKLTPIPWLRVESKLSPYLRFRSESNTDIIVDKRFHKSAFYLRGYSRITRRHELTCIRRGYYDLTRVTLSAGDLFGMSTTSREIVGNASIFVFPSYLSRDEIPDDALKWQGDITVRRWILPDPILVNGIREYRSGDSQKDIHWKASARTGELQVKTRDYTVSPRLLFVFNGEPFDNFWGQLSTDQSESMETGIRLLATFCDWAIDNGMDAGLYSGCTTATNPNETISILPAAGPPQLMLLLQTLAELKLKCLETIYQTLDRISADGISDTDILILSAFWNEGLEKRADFLRQRGNSVTRIAFRREVVNFESIIAEDAV